MACAAADVDHRHPGMILGPLSQGADFFPAHLSFDVVGFA
jgi:hypothetical protein